MTLQIHTIEQGKFKLDGGAMFGVVPRQLWTKLNTPDDNNMCTWSMRSLLIVDGDRIVLIDTGIGTKQSDKFRSHFEPFGHESYHADLKNLGYSPEDITDVFLTHLHFDHVGGALYYDSQGKVHATYPNAKYWSNELHYQWAIKPNPRESASFLKENILPLQDMGILHMIDVQDDIKFTDNISVRFLYGHTEAMMMPIIHTAKQRIFYSADLFPSTGHIGLPYVMSYDVRPLDTLKEKAMLFEDFEMNDLLLFEHDKTVEAATLVKNERGSFKILNSGDLTTLLK